MGVRGSGNRRPGRLHIPVEGIEQFFRRFGRRRKLVLDAIGSDVEAGLFNGGNRPVREIGKVSGEPAHGTGLLVRLPGKPGLRDTLEQFAGGGHLLIEFGEKSIGKGHSASMKGSEKRPWAYLPGVCRLE